MGKESVSPWALVGVTSRTMGDNAWTVPPVLLHGLVRMEGRRRRERPKKKKSNDQ